MSKLRESLVIHREGRALATGPFLVQERSEWMPSEDLYRYTATASVQASVIIDGQAPPAVRSKVLNRAWQLIQEEVFGEFRPLIHDVRKALYAGKPEEAIKALGLLQSRMFDIGEVQ